MSTRTFQVSQRKGENAVRRAQLRRNDDAESLFVPSDFNGGGTIKLKIYGNTGDGPNTLVHERQIAPTPDGPLAISAVILNPPVDNVAAWSEGAPGFNFRYELDWDTLAKDDRYPVILIAGQSNAEGFAPNSELPAIVARAAPFPHIKAFQATVGGWFAPLSAIATETPAGLVSTNKSTDFSEKFGPEMMFAARMQRRLPGKPFGMVKHAADASSLFPSLNTNFGFTNNWAAVGGTRRTAWTNRLIAANATALALWGKTIDIRGMIWHQGEADAMFGEIPAKFDAAIDGYAVNLEDLFDFFRTSIASAGYTTLQHPVPICQALINHDWYAEVPSPWQLGVGYSALLNGTTHNRLAGIDLVRQAQINVAAAMPYVFSIETSGLGNNGAGDMIHLNGEGQAEHGSGYADVLHPYLASFDPLQGLASYREVYEFDMRPAGKGRHFLEYLVNMVPNPIVVS